MNDAGDDTDVMFEIGVMESPETSSRITELAKSVLGAQDTMRQGVERIGLTAKSISASLVPLRAEIQAFRKEAQSLFSDVQSQSLKSAGLAARPVRPQMPKSAPVQELEIDRVQKTVQPRKDAPGNLPIDEIDATIREMKLSFRPLGVEAKSFRDDASEMLRDVSRAFEQVSSEAEKLKVRPTVPTSAKESTDDPKEWAQSVFDSIFRKNPVAAPPVSAPPANPGKSPLSDIPTNIESVMRKLGDDLRAETDSIVATFDSKIAALPGSLADANSKIKAEFDRRVRDQASAFEKMASDLDNAVEKQRDSTVDINSAVAKGARAVNEVAQGFAHLGLMSAESSEQMLKGLVVIQGAVDILDGSVDLLEAFSQGWKSVRKSVKAASDVQKAQQALSAAQLPQLRAYHASLMAEASAANIAATANIRLGASRRGALLGVGGLGKSVASGVATNAAGSAVGAVAPKVAGGIGGAVAGGAGATTFAGVGVGLLGTVAAAGAALASVSLVAVELKETLTGQAKAHDSVTGKIAAFQASIVSGGLRMTGMFERFDSPAVKFLQNLGSFGDKIVSTVPGLARFKDQLNFTGGLLGDLAGLAASTAAVERGQKSLAKNRVINDAGRARESVRNEFADKAARQNFDLRNETAKLRLDYRPQRAQAEIAQETAMDRMRLAQESQGRGDLSAGNRITAELAKIMRAQASLNSIAVRPANEQLSSERNLRTEAQKNLVSSTQRVEGIKNGSIIAEDSEVKKAGEQQLFWRDKVKQSIMTEMELIRQKRDIEIEGQKKVTALYGEQLSLKRQQLLLSIDAEEAAMVAFASLSNEDKAKAKTALQAGRMRPELLADEQKDLLRRVGTKESLTIAKQGDIAEAKRFGFGEENFGRGFKTEQKQLKSEVQRLEAQVSSSYDVQVKLETDNRGLVADLVTKTKALMAENNKAILEQFSREMKASELTITNTMNNKLKQLQK